MQCWVADRKGCLLPMIGRCQSTLLERGSGGVVGPRPLDGRGVFCTLACWVCGVGWGGDGMLTFDELAHMVDATQLVRGGWGGG